MRLPKKLKNILWDFDGVILDSMPIRNKGFELVLSKYPKEQVNQLMEFHLKNGGLSRYVKFRYFFEEIRQESVNNNTIQELANQFSSIMLKELLNPNLLIQDTISFIKKECKNYNMHIVSGSDGIELKHLCKGLSIADYFLSIDGSPTPKIQLVKAILNQNEYKKTEVVLIGDSLNDYNAASENKISFMGYNNLELSNIGAGYINNFCY